MTAIETVNLGKRFGSEWALQSVELAVAEAEMVGIVGPSGAGKSVLLDVLLGRERPTEGRVRVLGADPLTGSVRERVGCLREYVDLDPRVTGLEQLDHAVGGTGSPNASVEVLERVGIDLEDVTRPVETYPTGTRRRLGLALALAGDPDLLLVEEPTAGLDDEGIVSLEVAVREAVESGTAVVVFARQLSNLFEACDRVGYLDGGHLEEVLEETDAECGQEMVELAVDHVPPLALESIPGVEDVATTDGRISAIVSDPAAKATVVMEVGHAGVVVENLQVSAFDTGPVRREGSE